MKKTPRRIPQTTRHISPTRPTVAEVDLSAIAFNLNGVRKKVGGAVKIMAVVKANAYGHGLRQVAAFTEPALADYFGVAFPEEGVELRMAEIHKPIHVFTIAAGTQTHLYSDFDLEATVSSVRDLELLDRAAVKARRTVSVHLKIDTGMNRIGVKPADLEALTIALGRAKRLEVRGIFTHFATADEKNKQFLMHQLDEFQRALEELRKAGIEPEHVHCANSASILDVPETSFTMVRPGVMMYGYYPSRTTSESVPLKPAMALKTQITLVKTITPGESVSYGRRFIATNRTRIATLPVGYADGFTRLLSGKAEAVIHGRRFPVVGAICMDQLMVDVGEEEVEPGEEAVLIGTQQNERITAWDLAERLGTIPYEICCAVSSRVPRVYIQ